MLEGSPRQWTWLLASAEAIRLVIKCHAGLTCKVGRTVYAEKVSTLPVPVSIPISVSAPISVFVIPVMTPLTAVLTILVIISVTPVPVPLPVTMPADLTQY